MLAPSSRGVAYSGHSHLNTLAPGHYNVDQDHTELGFVVRQGFLTKVVGRFRTFDASAFLDPARPEQTRAVAEIDATSVSTGNEMRDTRLVDSRFFGHGEQQVITFSSTRIVRLDRARWVVTGDLTIKGITRPVSVEFTFDGLAADVSGRLLARFGGVAVVSRTDWDLRWRGRLRRWERLVSRRVTLRLEIAAERVDGPAAP